MAILQRIPVLYLYVNWRRDGWTERYFLPELDWPQAIDLGDEIAKWRIAAACTEAHLIWGRISYTDDPRLTQPITAIGLTSNGRANVGNGHPHTSFSRLHYRYETATGKYVNRLFGGIPDAAISDMGVSQSLQPLLPGELPADREDGGASWWLTFRSMVTYLRDQTVYASQAGLADPADWQVLPWSQVIFRKPTTHDTGRAFRRVTWLPAALKPAAAIGVDPPNDAAPAFNPCGAAVGVLRSCYSRACRWYVNGPIGRIRFSFVSECNAILPFRTVFWPYSQQREIHQLSHTGEITAQPMPWNNGTRRSHATGINPAGGAADFAGESLLPWDPPTPTPAASVPCCALGELIMEAIEYVRVTVTSFGAAYTRSGDIITANAHGQLGTLDGAAMANGDKALLRTGTADAGIWVLLDVGANDPGGRAFRWQRLQTCDGTAVFNPGQVIKVWDGATQAHTLWELQTLPPIVLNTSALAFGMLAGGGGGGGGGVLEVLELRGGGQHLIDSTCGRFSVDKNSGISAAHSLALDGFGPGEQISLLPASIVQAGVITTGNQTFGGRKSFQTTVVTGAFDGAPSGSGTTFYSSSTWTGVSNTFGVPWAGWNIVIQELLIASMPNSLFAPPPGFLSPGVNVFTIVGGGAQPLGGSTSSDVCYGIRRSLIDNTLLGQWFSLVSADGKTIQCSGGILTAYSTPGGGGGGGGGGGLSLPDVARSTITVSPSAVLADGSSAATITVVWRNSLGVGLSPKTTTAAPTSGSAIVSPASAISDGTGTCTFTATNLVIEYGITFNATDTNDAVTIGPSNAVDFWLPGVPDPALSSTVAGPTTIASDGIATTGVTITLIDHFGGPCAALATTFSATGTTGTQVLTPNGIGTTDGAGVLTFTCSDTTPESITFSAVAAGVTIGPSNTVVFADPTIADPTQCLLIASPATVYADGLDILNLTAVVKNAFGAVLPGHTATVAADSGSAAVLPASVMTNGFGIAAFTATDAVAESGITFTATDTTDGVSFGSSPPIDFIAISTTGRVWCTAAVNDNTFGTIDWNNTGNVFADDGVNADVPIPVAFNTSHVLKCSGFGLAIPGGATIRGIKVYLTCEPTIGGGFGATMEIGIFVNNLGTTPAGGQQTMMLWPATTLEFGDAHSLWGDTWTAADLNDPLFYIAVLAQNNVIQPPPSALLDGVSIQVWYD